MTQADILAIKVAVTNVANAQRSLASIQQRVDDMQKKNDSAMKRGGRFLMAWFQQNREHRNSVEGLVKSYARLAAAFGTVYGSALTMYKAIQSFENLKSFRQGLTAMVGGDSAGMIEKQARAFARQTGTRMTSFMPNIQGLIGTESAKPTEIVPLLRAFTALAKKNGALPDQIDRAFTQFTQVASQGKLQGDELRVMQENMVNLRGLLKRAGLGDRIGSQSQPITFEEIKKVLLRFGESADAAKYLAINSDSATASFNRLFDTIMLDVLPVFGKMLTPAAVELANWLESLAKKATPEVIERYTRKFVEFVQFLIHFIENEGPSFLSAIHGLANITIKLADAFMGLDKMLGGKLMKTLVALAAIRVVGGAVGGLAGGIAGAAGGKVGAFVAGLLGMLLGMMRSGLAKVIYWAVGAALSAGLTGLAEALAILGTAVASASAAVIAAVVAVGAAIGLAIGWLINQIPAVQDWQKGMGNWWNDTFGGGAKAKEDAAKADPAWQPGGRLYEKKRAEQSGRGLPSAQSARRSDPQRLITEAGANGVRYGR